AENGTVFLDEIGEIPLLIQTKLLRVLQEKEIKPVGTSTITKVNARVIAATNRVLEQEIAEGRFREDLFYRLAVLPIRVPPLRERKTDIPLLAEFFLKKYSTLLGKEVKNISSYALKVLLDYNFPGNVRELENIIERSVALSSTNIILPESLTIRGVDTAQDRKENEREKTDCFAIQDEEEIYAKGLDQVLAQLEKAIIEHTLKKTNNSKMKAADKLQVSFRSLRMLFGIRLLSTEAALSSTMHNYDKLSQLHKLVFDNISSGIITTDESLTIISANHATSIITGYGLEELVRQNLTDVIPKLLTSPRPGREAIDFTKKDGTPTRIGYSFTSFAVQRSSAKGAMHPLKEELFNLITLQDISEIEKLEAKIRQGEKMAAIGMMSAGIAHDFRNPLTAISGSAQILVSDYSRQTHNANSEHLALASIINREAERLNATISAFLEFAKPDIIKRKWFHLIDCVNEVLQVCQADPKWPAQCSV
ncbi:unnamed protein product, partial [Cyprideis torosa]